MEILDSTEGIILVSILGLLFSCMILHYVIKSAIKDAFKEMAEKNKPVNSPGKPIPAPNWTEAQLALKSKYEKGELTFEEYTTQWNKIS
jgi:hypothetical protein